MSDGPTDGSAVLTADTTPRSARFRRARLGSLPPLVAGLTSAPKPPELRFTPAADAAGTDRDVLIGYQLFLGRDPENSFVIANARASPVHGMVRGWITSEEFASAVLGPLDAGRPLPHEQASAGPDSAHTEWLLRHLALDPAGQVSVRDAGSWRDLLHVLVELPGFPRPHAISGGTAAAPGAAGEAQPGFILITIEQPRPGEALPGSRVEGSGWVIAPCDVSDIAVFHGDTLLAPARFGLPRPDVARRFPHYRRVDRCGFAFSVDIPQSIASDQTPLLMVQVRTADGELGRKGVRLRAQGARGRPDSERAAARPNPDTAVRLHDAGAAASPVLVLIDTPAPDGDAARVPADQALVIAGWAVALAGVAHVTLFCDEQALGIAHGGIRRPDLATAFVEYPDALLAGWSLVVPAGTLSPGGHRLRAVAASTSGETVEQGISIWVEADAAGAAALVRARMPAAEAAFGRRLLARQTSQPHFRILVDARAGDAAGLSETMASLRRQVFTNWDALVLAGNHASDGLAGSEQAVRTDRLVKLRAGDVLGCDALLEFAIAAAVSPDADFCYADEVCTDPMQGRDQPLYKPDFAPEMLLGINYLGRAWCARSTLLEAAGLSLASLAAASDYDAVLRLTEAAQQVAHASGILLRRGPHGDTPADEAAALQAALSRRGVAAELLPGPQGLWRVKRALPGATRLSIVMPTCGARGLVRRAIASIRETLAAEGAAAEIVIIDDLAAADKRTRTWLRKQADVVIKADGPFNWSRFNNLGAKAATGDVLLFLNDDIEMTASGWLEPMLEQALRPEAGVVGPKLLYPDGRVQHAGLYLAEGHGRHAFRFAEAGDLGPFGIGGIVREVAAVTGAAMMVRRDVFERLGGFDEAHSVINNDLDFCLRARAAGHAVIYTPHANMIHHELASRAAVDDSYDPGRFADAFRTDFAAGDPMRNAAIAPRSDQYAPEDEPAVLVHAGKAGPRRESVQNILALKLDHIGDFVTAVPALRALKARFPDAKLTLLAPAASLALAAREPAIDECLEFSFFHSRSTLGPRDVTAEELDALQTLLAPRGFDLAIDLRMQPQTRPVLRHTGAGLLAGYDHDGRFPWLDVALEWEGDRKLQRKRAPIAERLVQLVEATAAAFETRPVRPPAPEAPAEAIMALLPPAFAGRRLVCVHPDVGNPLRRWPATHFAALIDLLVARAQCSVVLIGSEDETPVADAVMRSVAPGAPVVSLAGTLPLADLPTLLQACALFVGNNSGPQHIAASLGVPTVGVHAGITDAREWGPEGEIAVAVQRRMRCGPCYIEFADECPREFACLTGLRPRDVFAACRRLLAAGAPNMRPANEDANDSDPDVSAETGAAETGAAETGAAETGAAPAAVCGDARLAAAAALALLPLPTDIDHPQGYIETMAAGDGGVWIMGWMKPGHALEFPAVVAELRPGGARHAAVVSALAYVRADLPHGAHGIIGLAACGWTPRLQDGVPEDVAVFFGDAGRHHLRCHQPLRLLTVAELASEYQGLQNRGLTGQQSPAMQRLLGALESWAQTKPGAAWMGTETSVDRILLVPGLGCFIEGWVLSPLRRVQGFRLRFGGVVMALQPHTLSWKPRPDLVAAYPGSEAMAARAGFVGLFESDDILTEYAEPILKILFEGGASVNWPIPPKVFRRLGHSARLEDVLRFFPALEEEAFFPAFARAASRAERALLVPAVPVQIAAAERVIVFALPQERCDLFLVFAEAARRARRGGGWGAVFLTSAGASRADALWLFREFERDCPSVAPSLLTIAEPSQAFALLPEVLSVVGARRFLFVNDGVFLTDAGWSAVPEALASAGGAPILFGDADGAVGARCFAWSSALLARWSARSVTYLGGIYRDNGLHAESADVLQGAVWCSRTVARSGLQAAVNRVLADLRHAAGDAA